MDGPNTFASYRQGNPSTSATAWGKGEGTFTNGLARPVTLGAGIQESPNVVVEDYKWYDSISQFVASFGSNIFLFYSFSAYYLVFDLTCSNIFLSSQRCWAVAAKIRARSCCYWVQMCTEVKATGCPVKKRSPVWQSNVKYFVIIEINLEDKSLKT